MYEFTIRKILTTDKTHQKYFKAPLQRMKSLLNLNHPGV